MSTVENESVVGYYALFLVTGLVFCTATLTVLILTMKHRQVLVHPKKIIYNQLLVAFLCSFRFLLIGLAYLFSGLDGTFDSLRGLDYGIFHLNCKLEGFISFMVLMWSLLWNIAWSHDLYTTVKTPMVYSEKKFPVQRVLVYVAGLAVALLVFLLDYLNVKEEESTICLVQFGWSYLVCISVPIVLYIVANTYIFLKYGREDFYKKYMKNAKIF